MDATAPAGLDVVIFGGGAAGLWLLDSLVADGFDAVLLEAGDLGSGQTIASQGIIHGGLKYTLGGMLTKSAASIRGMPKIWRRCLAGEARPNLADTRLRADYCHLWQTSSLRSRVAMMGARTGLQVKPVVLEAEQRPVALAKCPGVVARIDEQVIEPASFVGNLTDLHRARLMKIDAESGLEFEIAGPGVVEKIRLINPESGEPLDLVPRHVVLTAGAGNQSLRKHLKLPERTMQRRPLQIVMVRGDLPILNGHCVDGRATRLTITSTTDCAERTVWQLGGKLSEDGVRLERLELIAQAVKELEATIPGVDLRNTEWDTYRVDRAEHAGRGRISGGVRPDDVHVSRKGNTITAWPTKLALAPRLTEVVRTHLQDPQSPAGPVRDSFRRWPHPLVALPPWESQQQWYAVH